VLDGQGGPRRDIVLLNAGAALLIAGVASSIGDGVSRAAEAIDSGRARHALETLLRVCHR
jgi:anthranilate phosphoribosyltransferase